MTVDNAFEDSPCAFRIADAELQQRELGDRFYICGGVLASIDEHSITDDSRTLQWRKALEASSEKLACFGRSLPCVQIVCVHCPAF